MSWITKNEEDSFLAVQEYYKGVLKKAERKMESSGPSPGQHTIPKFLLSQIAQESPPYKNMKGEGLMLKEYSITFDKVLLKVIGDIESEGFVSPRKYSIREDIYTSQNFLHDYLLEIIFSIIEGDASKLIRSRLNNEYESIRNPYLFNAPGDYRLNTKLLQRAALSAFFAAQGLRSIDKRDAVINISKKYLGEGLDLATAIDNILFKVTMEFFERPWIWMRFPDYDFMISEQGLVSQKICKKDPNGSLEDYRSYSLLTLSRRDGIVFSDKFNGFYDQDDHIVVSDSEALFSWMEYMSIHGLFPQEFDRNRNKYKFVLNINAPDPSKYITPPGCCLRHCLLEKFSQDFTGTTIIDHQINL